MKKPILALTIAAAMALSAAAAEKVTVAAFEYPPIYQNKAEKGLACEIVIEAFKAAGLDAELQFYPVTRMVQMVAAGEVQCGIGGAVLFESAEIKPNVDVAALIQYVSQVFVYDTRKFPSGLPFAKVSDLSKYSMGVLGGSGIAKYLEKTPGLNLVTNTAHDGTARQLQGARVDLWAIVDLTGIMYMKQLFPAEAASYAFSKAFNKGDVSLVFSKKAADSARKAAKFKEGLALIKKNGTYMKIFEKYYGSKASINKDSLPEDMK